MKRRRSSALAGNPLLIGAITTLIVVVAVFLAYNANNGLPFVPTYDIKVALPEASGLIKSNEVRIAGTRIGVVNKLEPHQDPRTGRVTAIADLKLEKGQEPLPADTRAVVQSASSIGLKYLELEKGTSSQPLKSGRTIPVSHTREPVIIDEFFNMFDKPTRTAIKGNTNEFGNGLAGRGLGLNNTIHELRPLVVHAVPVLHNLALPETGLRELWKALDRAAEQAAPVANAQAAFFSDQDTFFRAFASVTPSLEAATEGGPAALKQATHSLPFEAPLIEKSTEFMHLLRPSAKTLTTIAKPLGHAFKVGAVNLAAATTLNTQLAQSSVALAEFAKNPIAALGLEDFTRTLQIGNPLFAGIAPAQAVCNYITLAFRNVASLESENVGVGSLARSGFLLAPAGVNNPGYPSSAPANGASPEREVGTGRVLDTGRNHIHVNPYPNVAGPGQPQICEAGNEGYQPSIAQIGNQTGVASAREITSREQNLYGEKYPSPTLKDLGLVQPKPKAKPKSKGKKK